MSVLLEALKKAALNKRSRQEDESAEPAIDAQPDVSVDDDESITAAPAENEYSPEEEAQRRAAREHWVNKNDAQIQAPEEFQQAPVEESQDDFDDELFLDEVLDTDDEDEIFKDLAEEEQAFLDEDVDSSMEEDFDIDLDAELEEDLAEEAVDLDESVVDEQHQDDAEDDDVENSPNVVEQFDFEEARPIVSNHEMSLEDRTERNLFGSEEGSMTAGTASSESQIQAESAVASVPDSGPESGQEEAADEEGKAAMTQLLAQSQSVANRARRRGINLYVTLFLTAIASIGSYYYYLSLKDYGLPSEIANYRTEMPQELPGAPVLSVDTPELTTEVAASETLPASMETQVSPVQDASAVANSQLPRVITESIGTSVTEKSAPPPVPARVNVKMFTEATGSTEPADIVREEDKVANILDERIIAHQRTTPTRLFGALQSGYRALQSGDLTAAGKFYETALALSPGNRDALLGAAALAFQEQRYDDALGLYQQRLNDAPTDELARTGILTLTSLEREDPILQTEVDRMLLQFPDAAHLHFLKGSLHASAREWRAAEKSFFNAFMRDRTNPDYNYNLAVALDYLNQRAQAAHYYQDALALSDAKTSHFSADSVYARLATINESAGKQP